MRRPANVAGVIFGLAMAAVLLVLGFVLGWGETTRRGLPVWGLGVVGVGCFGALVVQSWLKPRKKPGAEGPAVTRGAKAAMTGAAIWFLLPVAAALVGLTVAALR
jgi:hypothetical protein